MAIKISSKYVYVFVIILFAVALVAAGAIRSKTLPYGSIQWLPV
jgi:hypothetical protein